MLQIINKHFRGRYTKHYRRGYWHIIADAALLFAALSLAAIFTGIMMYKPSQKIVSLFFIPNPQQGIEVPDKNYEPLELSFAWQKQFINRKDKKADLSIEIKNISPNNIDSVKISFLDLDDTSVLMADSALSINDVASNSAQTLNHNIPLNFGSEKKNIVIKAKVEYKINNRDFEKEISLPILPIKTDIFVKAAAIYTSPDGDKLGLGPLPPIVGEPTNYWVFFEAESDGNISSFILTADLPQGVEFSSNYSLLTGKLEYDQVNRRIKWTIDNINAEDGKQNLGVEVVLIPKKEQIGLIPVLVNNIKYKAKDRNLDTDIVSNVASIDTSLPTDHFNKDKGKVAENN